MTENEISKIVFDCGLKVHQVEVKSVEALNDIHLAQVLTYLKLSGCKLGLLINFNSVLYKDGVKRIINGTL